MMKQLILKQVVSSESIDELLGKTAQLLFWMPVEIDSKEGILGDGYLELFFHLFMDDMEAFSR